MKMKIFGQDAEFDQVAIHVKDPSVFFSLGKEWQHDMCSAMTSVHGQRAAPTVIELHYNYDQELFDFKELELITLRVGVNWHCTANKRISPLGLYAPFFWEKMMRVVPDQDFANAYLSHLGIHSTEEEAETWRKLFQFHDIFVAQENWSTQHTNPKIAGNRWYHDVIFDSRSVLGFDMKITVRHDKKGAGYVGTIET